MTEPADNLPPGSSRRRMAESERYPSWCIMHKRLVRWIPFPGWWIHDNYETCVTMLAARAPEGLS